MADHYEVLGVQVADLLSLARPAAGRSRPARPATTLALRDDAAAAGLLFEHNNGHASERNPPPTEEAMLDWAFASTDAVATRRRMLVDNPAAVYGFAAACAT